MRHGIEPPKEQFKNAGTHWSNEFMKWLQELEFERDGLLRFTLDQFIDYTLRLRKQKAAVFNIPGLS